MGTSIPFPCQPPNKMDFQIPNHNGTLTRHLTV